MNLDVLLLHNAGLDEEIRDVLPLITLELNDLSKFWVLDHCTIAAELFLEIFEDLAVAELLLQSLDGSQALATITLLDAHVYVVL